MLEKVKKAEILADSVGDFAKLQVSAMAELSSEVERMQSRIDALEGVLKRNVTGESDG